MVNILIHFFKLLYLPVKFTAANRTFNIFQWAQNTKKERLSVQWQHIITSPLIKLSFPFKCRAQ